MYFHHLNPPIIGLIRIAKGQIANPLCDDLTYCKCISLFHDCWTRGAKLLVNRLVDLIACIGSDEGKVVGALDHTR